MCKRLLADRLGCEPPELESRGFVVRSAGVAAFPGDAASQGSVVVAPEFGATLDSHRSSIVNPELLEAATDVFVMSRNHQYVLEMRFPGIGPAPRLLCGDEGDLEDPVGGDVSLYRSCALTIHRHLQRIISEWLDS